MKLRTFVIALAIGLLAVAPAIAEEAVSTSLVAGPAMGYYGQDCVLTPQTSATTMPKQIFEFQIRQDGSWVKYEDQAVEDTGTVDPMHVVFSDEIPFPSTWRVRYLQPSKDASGNAIMIEQSVSAPVYLKPLKFSVTKTALNAPKSAKKGSAFSVTTALKPYAGIAKYRIVTERLVAGKWNVMSTKTITSDDSSEASTKLKPSRAGIYRISAKFLGNKWAASSSTVRTVVYVR